MPLENGGMNESQKSQLLPLGNMARRLRVTAAWLKSEAEAGRVPALKAGARLLFLPEAVEAVLVRRATAASTKGGTDGK